MKRAIIALLMLSVAAAEEDAQKPKEQVEIDPTLQGVWVIVAESKDGGKTADQSHAGDTIARAYATKIKFPGGKEWKTNKILLIPASDPSDPKQRSAEILTFIDNGETWEVHDSDSGNFMLYVVDGDTKKETVRALFRVKE